MWLQICAFRACGPYIAPQYKLELFSEPNYLTISVNQRPDWLTSTVSCFRARAPQGTGRLGLVVAIGSGPCNRHV